MSTATPSIDAPGSGSTTRVVALISTAHFFSHFYMLLLAPLFPFMRDDFAVGFTELGFAITVFSLTTGITQAPMGFLVDRFGARGLLTAALMLESVAIMTIGLFHSYAMLVGLMVVAGLANAVYHPADYSILNARVPTTRIGRAFSIHTFSGYLGTAIAPPLVVMLATAFGWSNALVVCGAIGGLLAVVLAFNLGALDDADPRAATTDTGPARRGGLGVLFTVPLLLAVLFFTGLSMSGYGINSFAISALGLTHPGDLTRVTLVVSAFLFASPIGVLTGGWIADRISRHDLFVVACLATLAACMFTTAALTPPLPVTGLLFAVGGFAAGCVAPSRDMMVRALTPPGQSGKVFGFVSTGYNIGGIVAPPVFGLILDQGNPDAVFWTVGAVAVATILTVTVTGRSTRRQQKS